MGPHPRAQASPSEKSVSRPQGSLGERAILLRCAPGQPAGHPCNHTPTFQACPDTFPVLSCLAVLLGDQAVTWAPILSAEGDWGLFLSFCRSTGHRRTCGAAGGGSTALPFQLRGFICHVPLSFSAVSETLETYPLLELGTASHTKPAHPAAGLWERHLL